MNIPKNLKYARTHEWVELLPGGRAKIGITDFAQNELGDIVFINLPDVGDSIALKAPFAEVESVKAVSEVYSPVAGVICAVNDELDATPELINESPYEAWLIEVENIKSTEDLMDAAAYEEFASQEG